MNLIGRLLMAAIKRLSGPMPVFTDEELEAAVTETARIYGVEAP